MKKKRIVWLLCMSALAAACSDDLVDRQSGSAVPDGEYPVSFSAYTNRGTTRAGVTGELTTAKLTNSESPFYKKGFGVFAYYTDAEDYVSDARPNFMFNQQVLFNASSGFFDYTPVRYWPNEYGQKAQSEDIDKVSFFAYAPYVAVKPSTGYLDESEVGDDKEETTWGITGTSRNTYTGDPLVKYITTFDMDHGVDLCWGVYAEGNSGWATMNGKQTTLDGLPWLNVEHARSIDQRLRFTFHHALTRLNVQIDTNVDGGADTKLGTHYGLTDSIDHATKVYVRSVTFTGIADKGALNLNNVKPNIPLWMNYTGTGWIESGQTLTVHDGLRDGYEGTSNAVASNETQLGLNPQVISNYIKYDPAVTDDETGQTINGIGNTTPGVTDETRNLFGHVTTHAEPEKTAGVYVIPTGEAVKITIVYDVETAVPNLPGYLSDGTTHGTSIENRITSELKINDHPLTFEGGRSYTIRLHLGMNSVKFSAEVGEWPEEETIIDVPHVLSFTKPDGTSAISFGGTEGVDYTLDGNGNPVYTADGTGHGPTLSGLTDENNTPLTTPKDYVVTYSGILSDGTFITPDDERYSSYFDEDGLPIYPGTYTMTVTGKGDYEGASASQTFTIDPKPFDVSVPAGVTGTNDKLDADELAQIKAQVGGSDLDKGTKEDPKDYRVLFEGTADDGTFYSSYDIPTKPGNYTWTVQGSPKSLYGGYTNDGSGGTTPTTGSFKLIPTGFDVTLTPSADVIKTESKTVDDGAGGTKSVPVQVYAADGTPKGPDASGLTIKDENGNKLDLTPPDDFVTYYSGTDAGDNPWPTSSTPGAIEYPAGSGKYVTTQKPSNPGNYQMTVEGKGDYEGVESEPQYFRLAATPITLDTSASDALSGLTQQSDGSFTGTVGPEVVNAVANAIKAADADGNPTGSALPAADFTVTYYKKNTSTGEYEEISGTPTAAGDYKAVISGNADTKYGGEKVTIDFTFSNYGAGIGGWDPGTGGGLTLTK